MLFNSYTFAVFFLLVFILFWMPVRRHRLAWQNAVILVAGYVFYGFWDWRFLFLIALTSLTSWIAGMLIERKVKPRLVSAANIIINIGVLAYFKYFDFFVDGFVGLFSLFGIEVPSHFLEIVLPVGISFYTFQALSYSIDVYRGNVPACHDPVRFFAFVSFFPALVAGPIERAQNLLPQFDKVKERFDYDNAVEGVMRILYGLFLKIVIADRLAVFVNGVWEQLDVASWIAALLAMMFFAYQLYLDFAAYSEIAKGTARLLGFEVMTNFRRPYLSSSFKEFWKRWHISLSSWFMDYVYIPLGGNRRGELRRCINLLIVFLLSGLWHGASWNFVLWGFVNGMFLIVFDKIMPKSRLWAMRLMNIAVVFSCWMFSLILFRASSIGQTWEFINCLSVSGDMHQLWEFGLGKSEFFFALSLIVLLVLWEYIQEKWGTRMMMWLKERSSVFRCVLAVIVIVFIVIFGRYGIGNDSSFIYFQF